MSNDAIHWARQQTVGGCGRKAVLLTLADRADEAWSCFPGQQLIADETEQSVRSVRSHLVGLEEAGYISRIERRREDGSRTSDRYQLNRNRKNLPVADNRQPSPPTTGKSCTPTGNEPQTNRQLTAGSPETVSGHEPKEEPSVNPQKEPSTRERVARDGEVGGEAGGAVGIAGDFAAFYAAYPRRTGRAAAQKAWAKAVKGVAAEVIIAGAVRYRDDPNREPAFTKHPATWLNQGCWDDEPLPARARTGAAANQQHHDDLFAAAARRAAAAESQHGHDGLRAVGGAR